MLCPVCVPALILVLLSVGTATADSAPPTRLAVLVVFDQMRGDYLTRWQTLFGEHGFRRLMHDGSWYSDCHYPYAFTVTGAGHASLATGAAPRAHGVVGNEWYERTRGELVNCVENPRFQNLPLDPGTKSAPGGWPGQLLAPTLADALKQSTGNKARVVSLSFKDRGAILPGGQHPDACYWFDTATGRFVTSTYYRDRPHAWVEKFNAGRPANAWFGRPWERLRPDLDYTKYSGPDDAPGESGGAQQGVAFPHPMTGGLPKPGRRYYDALFLSPFGNELLLDLTLAAIDAEALGRDETPDLLCVSFSSNDYVGHSWGPDSQEVLDVTLRSDVIMQKLLDRLDQRIGKGRYILALSADHGVCPLPEASRQRGLDARRVPAAELAVPAEKFLREKFHASPETLCFQRFRGGNVLLNESFYLNKSWLRDAGLQSSVVEAALAAWLRQQPAVASAWTATELAPATPPANDIGKREWYSYYSGRSGDVMVVLKPYFLFATGFDKGTTHGTPYPYDTHVPLLVFGPKIKPGEHKEAITPLAAARILAHGLGIAAPAKCDSPLPAGLFQ